MEKGKGHAYTVPYTRAPMSDTQFHLGASLRTYLQEHSITPGDVLDELPAAAAEAGLPQIHISSEQGALMRTLIELVGAREIVEVGTLGGYSGIWMAQGLQPGGRLRTLEIDPNHAAFARSQFERAGLSDRVEVLVGDARETIASMEPQVDAVFIDADKAGYATYVDHARRLLRPGGLLMVDNAFAFGELLDETSNDPSVFAIREINDRLARDPALRGTICPLGDGFWVMTKVENPA